MTTVMRALVLVLSRAKYVTSWSVLVSKTIAECSFICLV